MPEMFNNLTTTQIDPPMGVLITRLLLAWFCGLAVAWLARRKKPAGTADTLSLTLVLMSILIAMATQIIGDNIARAFSLVGALSIVRFRTAVPETRDVAFVLAAVVVGMAVGAGQYWVGGIGLFVVALATQFQNSEIKGNKTDDEIEKPDALRLTIQVGLSDTRGWESEIERLTNTYQLVSAETTRRGGAMEMVYRIHPKSQLSGVDFISALNLIPSVEAVAIKAI